MADRSNPPALSRRRLLGGIVAAGALAGVGVGWSVFGSAEAQAAEMTVYKSPTCGCCSAWIDHMRAAGFTVTARDVDDVGPIKERHGVPMGLGSCHTAVIDGYVVEGHVPADSVRRLLAERPDAAGLAVPGMPSGSPGMENGRRDPYDVLLFDTRGGVSVWDRHR